MTEQNSAAPDSRILRGVAPSDLEPRGPAPKAERHIKKSSNMLFIRQLLEHHNGDKQRTAQALGYGSAQVLDNWAKAHQAPAVACLAAEALMRRLGTTGRSYELRAFGGTFAAFATLKTVGDALGMTSVFENFPVAEPKVGGSAAALKAYGTVLARVPLAHLATMDAVAKAHGISSTRVEL